MTLSVGQIKRQRRRAFTLIELVLVLALLVVITSLAAPAMSNFIRGRALDSESRRLFSLIHAAQSRAVSEGMPMVLWVDEKNGSYGFQEETTGKTGDPEAETLTVDSTLQIAVLAAMLFLAIVIPVAVEALHVSSLAGEVAARKGSAARIADRVLNESLVTTNWTGGGQSGTVSEGAIDYRWDLSAQNWPQAQSPVNSMISMETLTAQVTFPAQGKDYSVKLSTLVSLQTQPGQPGQPAVAMNSR